MTEDISDDETIVFGGMIDLSSKIKKQRTTLDSQSRGPVFKTIGWLQGQLSPSSFRGQ